MPIQPIIGDPSQGGTWGIVGGTFNPIHIAHLIMADSVMHSVRADGMLFVPAGIHPVKRDELLESSYNDRAEMVKLAIARNDRFCFEEGPDKSGYTIDLIDLLRRKYPSARFILTIGSDLIEEFDSWYKFDKIERNIRIVIAARPGFKLKKRNDGVLKDAECVMIPQLDISSSEIRDRIRSGKSVRYMVPEAVEKYIREKGLYAE